MSGSGSSLGRAARSAVTRLADAINPWRALPLAERAWRAADAAAVSLAARRAAGAGAAAAGEPSSASAASADPSFADGHHRALDTLVSSLKSFRGGWPGLYFTDGWGDVAALARVVARIEDVRALPPAREPAVRVPPLAVELRASDHGRPYARVLDGAFAAPRGVCTDALPPAARAGRVQLVLPAGAPALAAAPGAAPAPRAQLPGAPAGAPGAARAAAPDGGAPRAPTPLVVLLAGTGEHGFRRRRHLVAYPLAARGVASLTLEIPFYGSRRPPGQTGSKLRALAELPLQGGAVIDEARALVAWAAAGAPSTAGAAAAAAAAVGDAERAAAAAAAARGAASGGSARAGAGGGSAPLPPPVPPPLAPPPPPPAPPPLPPPGEPTGAFFPIVLAGVSMGGLHAAMAACTLPASLPVGVASWLGPPTASTVYTTGRLAHAVDWAALAAGARDAGVRRAVEDIEAAVARAEAAAAAAGVLPAPLPRAPPPPPTTLRALAAAAPRAAGAAVPGAVELAARLLSATDLLNFGRPVRPDAAVFVTAASDEYVPAEDESIRAMWARVARAWPGASVRRVRGGHVSASVLSGDSFVESIHEVVRRAAAPPPPAAAAAAAAETAEAGAEPQAKPQEEPAGEGAGRCRQSGGSGAERGGGGGAING